MLCRRGFVLCRYNFSFTGVLFCIMTLPLPYDNLDDDGAGSCKQNIP